MAKNKWLYGDAWENFPIEPGQVWGTNDGSKVAVHNIFNPLPDFMLCADLLFIDPPWNLANINSFYTKAGRSDYIDQFDDFADLLYERIAEIGPQTTYIEIGNQNVDNFYDRLDQLYPYLQRWPVLYYRKHPTWLIRGSEIDPIDYDFTEIDEAKCIQIVAKIENYKILGDLCMGQGLVGLAANQVGKPFVGTELNKRRLANLLQKLAKRGQKVVRYGNDK
jgi:hypothetical protein